jgi:hypothetical protein
MLPDMQKAITVTVPTESQHGPLTLDEIGPAAAALRERLVECCGGFVMSSMRTVWKARHPVQQLRQPF